MKNRKPQNMSSPTIPKNKSGTLKDDDVILWQKAITKNIEDQKSIVNIINLLLIPITNTETTDTGINKKGRSFVRPKRTIYHAQDHRNKY